MLEVLQTIFWGLVLLIIIVFIHEFGHFITARAFKVRVTEFMVGLPGPNIGFKRHDTKYGVTAIPLGGYCRIAGMEGGEDNPNLAQALTYIAYFGKLTEEQADKSSEALGFDLVPALDTLNDWGTCKRTRQSGRYIYEISDAYIDGMFYAQGQERQIANPEDYIAAERKQTYSNLPWWKRIVVLVAGSAFNLIFAILVMTAILMFIGSQVATTTVDTVVPDSPAAAAQIQPGDVLLAVDGQQFDSWSGFTQNVSGHKVGDTVELGILRDGAEQILPITLADNQGSPMVGVTSVVEKQPIAIGDALQTSFSMIGLVANAILQLVNPATFSDTISQTSSVVGISVEAKSAASSGFVPFLLLIAALSISIGLMNLLPVPPLDGGKIIVETIERITRRKISPAIINGIAMVGVAAMIMLVVFATNADIHRYFLGG
jgi:regulator of sigma E protease